MLSLRTCSLRRYRIEGPLPAPASAEFAERLTDRRFLPLAAREEKTYGWVTADNLLLTTFDADTLLRGEHVAVGLRIDRRRVNARLLRAQLDLETRARKKAGDDGAGPRRMSREERQELRQHLQQELLRQTSPSVEAHTVLIDTRRRLVLMLSLARTANEALAALFQDTFGAALVPLTPWKRALEMFPRERALDALERTEFWPTELGGREPVPARATSALLADRRLPS
jgi:recombination associated protein RdgC